MEPTPDTTTAKTPKRGRTGYPGRPLTIWVPPDLDKQIEECVAAQIARAAASGQTRQLPTRHAWILAAVRAALAPNPTPNK